jgi:hypothetical protein
MDIDTDKIDEAILALLHLTLHEGNRVGKGVDCDAMNLDLLHSYTIVRRGTRSANVGWKE